MARPVVRSHTGPVSAPAVQPGAKSYSRMPSEILTGSVERITFHNAENGYCVLRAKVRGQRDLVTVIGHTAAIGAGEHIEVSGT